MLGGRYIARLIANAAKNDAVVFGAGAYKVPCIPVLGTPAYICFSVAKS